MDWHLNKDEQLRGDDYSQCNISLQASPYNPYVFDLKENFFHPIFMQSPFEQHHVLSRSVTLNELEDDGGDSDNIIYIEFTRENSYKDDADRPQLLIHGKPYTYNDNSDWNENKYWKPRVSLDSTVTNMSESCFNSQKNSPLMSSDNRVMVNIKDNDAIKNHFQTTQIDIEKTDRRMSTILLGTFNSFSSGMPLISRSNCDDKKDKSIQKINKRISKQKTNCKTAEKPKISSVSKKSQRVDSDNINATFNNIEKFTNQCFESISQRSVQFLTPFKEKTAGKKLKESYRETPNKMIDIDFSIEKVPNVYCSA